VKVDAWLMKNPGRWKGLELQVFFPPENLLASSCDDIQCERNIVFQNKNKNPKTAAKILMIFFKKLD